MAKIITQRGLCRAERVRTQALQDAFLRTLLLVLHPFNLLFRLLVSCRGHSSWTQENYE